MESHSRKTLGNVGGTRGAQVLGPRDYVLVVSGTLFADVR